MSYKYIDGFLSDYHVVQMLCKSTSLISGGILNHSVRAEVFLELWSLF